MELRYCDATSERWHELIRFETFDHAHAKEYFGFTPFALAINETARPPHLDTDSRLRPDIRALEEGASRIEPVLD